MSNSVGPLEQNITSGNGILAKVNDDKSYSTKRTYK